MRTLVALLAALAVAAQALAVQSRRGAAAKRHPQRPPKGAPRGRAIIALPGGSYDSGGVCQGDASLPFHCGETEFCVEAGMVCDGKPDCALAADEGADACGDQLSTIAVGYSRRFVSRVQRRHRGLRFRVCSERSCNELAVRARIAADGTTHLAAARRRTLCDRHEWNSCFGQDITEEGLVDLPYEAYIMIVQRDAMALTVALHDKPTETVNVSAPNEGFYVYARSYDFDPLFDGTWEARAFHVNSNTPKLTWCTNFKCDAGGCIDDAKRCDGEPTCDDGSDEGPEACAPGERRLQFRPGGNRRASAWVGVAAEHRGVLVLGCNSTRCGVVRVQRLSTGRTSLSFWAGRDCQMYRWRSCEDINDEGDPADLPVGRMNLSLAIQTTTGGGSRLVVTPRGPDGLGGRGEVALPPGTHTLRLRPLAYDPDFQGGFECGPKEFRCDTNECVPMKNKCDGNQNCADVSDEKASECWPQEGAGKSHVTEILHAGEMKSVRVRFDNQFSSVKVMLCNETLCSGVSFGHFTVPRVANGTRFQKAWRCLWPLWATCYNFTPSDAINDVTQAKSNSSFLFLAEHRGEKLAVSLRERPWDVALVDAPRGAEYLRMRPTIFNETFSPVVCNEDSFPCRDSGQCVSSPSVCDGIQDCSDNSDEEDTICHLVKNFDGHGPGSTVILTVNVTRLHQGFQFFACAGAANCTEVRVEQSPVGAQPRLLYTRRLGCDWPTWRRCSKTRYTEDPAENGKAARPLPAGSYTLVLQRRQATLAVWQLGRPAEVAVIEVVPNATLLRVRPFEYSEPFEVTFADAPNPRPPSLAPEQVTSYPFVATVYSQLQCGATALQDNWVLTVDVCGVIGSERSPFNVVTMGIGNNQQDRRHGEPITGDFAGPLILFNLQTPFTITAWADILPHARNIPTKLLDNGETVSVAFFVGEGPKKRLYLQDARVLQETEGHKCGLYGAMATGGKRCAESMNIGDDTAPLCMNGAGSPVLKGKQLRAVLLAVQCDTVSSKAYYTLEPIGPHVKFILRKMFNIYD